MNKITTLLLSGLLLFSMNAVIAADSQNETSNYDSQVRDYNFEDYSYNVSDEQLTKEDQEDLIKKDEKESFWKKIINSSHFSSNTATKTWIPLNRAE